MSASYSGQLRVTKILNCDCSVDATGVLSCLSLAHTMRRWSNDRSDSFNSCWTDSIFESVQQLSRCRINERRLSAARSHCAILRLVSTADKRQKSHSVSRALDYQNYFIKPLWQTSNHGQCANIRNWLEGGQVYWPLPGGHRSVRFSLSRQPSGLFGTSELDRVNSNNSWW